MADSPQPSPKRIPPLAIIVVVILAALVVIALVQIRGVHHTPSGQLPAPTTTGPSVMPQQSDVPNAQQPASPEAGAIGHRNNDNEPGGPATTANVVGAPRG